MSDTPRTPLSFALQRDVERKVRYMRLDIRGSSKTNIALSLLHNPRFRRSAAGLCLQYQQLRMVLDSCEHVKPETLQLATEQMNKLLARAERRGLDVTQEVLVPMPKSLQNFVSTR